MSDTPWLPALSRKSKAVIRLPFRVLGLEGPIHASRRFLRDEGWLRSYRERRPVTAGGAPIPWYTYSAIDFLGERLPSDASVFEYGCGNSTLWYAERCARVVSVDPNPAWAKEVAARAPANVTVVPFRYPEDREAYVAEIENHGGSWDVVAIDSAWRVESSRAAVRHLTERGVIVWDNSTLPEFEDEMRDIFAPAGFRALPFGGLIPIIPTFDRTSVLYRPGNLLGI